jgi:2'-hydroxyisoflavone reductase
MTSDSTPDRTPDRRTFLRRSAAAGGALAVGSLVPFSLEGSSSAVDPVGRQPGRSLRILILGGTGFTGPAQVRYAIDRGHSVTVFNRGRSEADLPPQVEELVGDRNVGALDALRGREWDVVIDNPTTLPFWVRDVAEILNGRVGRYVFISTLSVYDLQGVEAVDEETPVLPFRDGDPLAVTPEQYQAAGGGWYGPLKAASEAEAIRWFGLERTTIIRPGLIVGPRDETDRFTYWPARIARGGEVLAPGDGRDAVQIIDARDLAEWTIRMVEEGTSGTFNACGPRSPLTMAEQLHGIRAALPGDLADLRFTWVPAEFLEAHGVRRWSEMTTWFGPDAPISRTSNVRAVNAGLTFRPLARTTADTLDWFKALPSARQEGLRAGLDPEKEASVLAAWHERSPGRAGQLPD